MLPIWDTLRAALFDLDGTLIETHIDFPAMTRAMREMARDAGVPAGVIDGKDILGMVAAAAQNLAARGGDGPAFRQQAFARLEEMEVEGCSRPRLLPGSDALLAALRERNVKVAVVTRNCRRVSSELLARFELPHDLLLTRNDVPRAKPDPDHLRRALAFLDVPPEAALMAGDHFMDIQAGCAAGCAVTVGVLGAHDVSWFAPCPPTFLVRDLADLTLPSPSGSPRTGG